MLPWQRRLPKPQRPLALHLTVVFPSSDNPFTSDPVIQANSILDVVRKYVVDAGSNVTAPVGAM